MSKLDKDQVLAAFSEAYEKANGKQPQIEAKGGWYSVDGGKNMRLAQLAEMTSELAGSASSDAVEEKNEKAPAATKKPAQKKAAAPKAKKAKKGSFSVKDFWIAKIQAENEGSIKPR